MDKALAAQVHADMMDFRCGTPPENQISGFTLIQLRIFVQF
jgi:hypothetical protein